MFERIKNKFEQWEKEIALSHEVEIKADKHKYYGHITGLLDALNKMELWDKGNEQKKRNKYLQRPIKYYTTIFCDGSGAIFKCSEKNFNILVQKFKSIEELEDIVKEWKDKNLKGAPGL